MAHIFSHPGNPRNHSSGPVAIGLGSWLVKDPGRQPKGSGRPKSPILGGESSFDPRPTNKLEFTSHHFGLLEVCFLAGFFLGGGLVDVPSRRFSFSLGCPCHLVPESGLNGGISHG